MKLISHRWSHHANHWYQDPTQRGLLTGNTLSNKHSQIRLLSLYWPVPTQPTNTPCHCTHMSSSSYSSIIHSRTLPTLINITHSPTYRT